MKINTLATPTFGWLRMNGAELKKLPAIQKFSPAIELPEDVRVQKTTGADSFPAMRTGCGDAFGEALSRAGIPVMRCRVPEGIRVPEQDALRLWYDLPDSGEEYDPEGREKTADAQSSGEECRRGAAEPENRRGSADEMLSVKKKEGAPAAAGRFSGVAIELGKNSALTVVMDYRSAEKAKGLSGVQTKIALGEGAKLTLVQIIRAGDGYTFLNDVGASCEKNAELRVIHLILSGKNVYQGLSAALAGEKSRLTADIGYIGADHAHYDMNYEAVHTGKRTVCDISAKGVLRDHASKVFRDTIDFRHGCAGAVGDETEDALLMDAAVGNKSIPIILCAEEDVVGNHGATIGRLDENLVFYMESRGMRQSEIYEMMAKARLDAIIRKIPDVKTRCELLGSGEE